MRRRRFLGLGTAGMIFLAGCPSQSGTNTQPSPTDDESSETPSQRSTATPAATPTVTPTAAQFELRNLQYPENLTVGDRAEIRVKVENVGEGSGTEAITLFWADSATSKTIELEPGTRGTVTFTPEPVASGDSLTFRVAAQSDSFLQRTIQISERTLHHVGPNGSDTNPGTKRNPLATIQHALERATPGDTIYVHPGQYFETLQTTRPGEPGAPITITGPPEAILSGEKREGFSGGFQIGHSHVHLTGLTIDGLQDPSNPDDARSYMNIAVNCLPRNDEYLTDLVITPHAIGNTRGSMVDLNFVENVEAGAFRLIGPCGLDYLLDHEVGHFGEIVYLGSPPGATFNSIDRKGELAGDIDSSNGVHIHHIDNSAGHGHIELFDIKAGTHDVLVEYCTSVDARLPSDNDHSSAVHIGGHDVTFRWNRIVSPVSRAIDVGNYAEFNSRFPHPDAPKAATRNAIYGNELLDVGSKAIEYTSETSEQKQRIVCGNVVDGETDGTPTKACSEDLPTSDGRGHTGGESPWV